MGELIEGFPPLVYVGTIKTPDSFELRLSLSNSFANQFAAQFATRAARAAGISRCIPGDDRSSVLGEGRGNPHKSLGSSESGNSREELRFSPQVRLSQQG